MLYRIIQQGVGKMQDKAGPPRFGSGPPPLWQFAKDLLEHSRLCDHAMRAREQFENPHRQSEANDFITNDNLLGDVTDKHQTVRMVPS